MTIRPSRLLPLVLAPILFHACAPTPAPPFRPPTQPIATPTLATATLVPQLYSPAPPTPTTIIPTATADCYNDLQFVSDATIPDGTIVSPGESVDKRWIISNSGTCNWDARYRLRLIGGAAMGAAIEQSLFPARAGTQATIQIVFAAPSEAGYYESRWQAYGPDNAAFGQDFYMMIVVSP